MEVLSRWRYRVVLGLGILASAAAYSRLPSIRYDIAGILIPARPLIAGLLPALATGITLSIRTIWKRDLVRDREADFEPTYDGILFAVVFFVIAIHLMVMAALANVLPLGSWFARATVVLFGLMVIRVGNLLPRTRPNLAIGIPTPRMLSDRKVWMLTHRTAGYLSVVLGAIIAVAGATLSRQAIPSVVAPALLVSAGLLFVMHYRHVHAEL